MAKAKIDEGELFPVTVMARKALVWLESDDYERAETVVCIERKLAVPPLFKELWADQGGLGHPGQCCHYEWELAYDNTTVETEPPARETC